MESRNHNRRTKRHRRKTKRPASPDRPAHEGDLVLNRPRKAYGILYMPHDLPRDTTDEKELQETNVQKKQESDEENIVLPDFKRQRIVPIFRPRPPEARKPAPPMPKFDIKPKRSLIVQQQEVAQKEALRNNQTGGLQILRETSGFGDDSVSSLKELQVFYGSDDSQD